MNIIFESELVGDQFRGLVVDTNTFQVIARTGTYVSVERAKSAAESMYRAMKKQGEMA